jgi:hypothetical protein
MRGVGMFSRCPAKSPSTVTSRHALSSNAGFLLSQDEQL